MVDPSRSRWALLAVAVLAIGGVAGCGSSARDTSVPPVSAPVVHATTTAPLSAPQRDAADAALAAYQGYMKVRVAAAAKPDVATVAETLSPYVADPLKTDLTNYIRSLHFYHEALHGVPKWTLVSQLVRVDATPQTVDLKICVDPQGWYVVDARTGKALESTHKPRYLTTAHMEDYGSPFGWLVNAVDTDKEGSC